MSPATNQFFEQSELNRFFTEAGSRMAMEDAIAPVSLEELNRFFNSTKHQMERAEQLDRMEASGFNVFELIRPDENRLSDVLALLLNPRGAHGQGDLFLRLLLTKLNADLSTARTKHAWVQREAPTRSIKNNRRRMDVLVNAGDLVVIENKVNAAEGLEQVKDYLEHLRHCIRDCSVRGTLIYLSPGGRFPGSINREDAEQEIAEKRLRCWSYGRELRAWLEECRRQCEAPRFRNFLSDFIQYIEMEIEGGPEYEQQQ
jgi:hypothetical protein